MAIRKRAHAQSGGVLSDVVDQTLGENVYGTSIGSRRKGSHRAPSIGRIFLIGLCVAFLGAVHLGIVGRNHQSTATAVSGSEAANKVASPAKAAVAPKPKDWSHCRDRPPDGTTRATDKKLEPLWLPTYPTSLPASYESFLKALTGIPTAAKNYYRQSKSLRRCHAKNTKSNIDGITCEVVHPIIPCERPHPSAQKDNFGRAVLLATRNPLTAFPAFHQEKAVKYHGQQGQVSKENWVKFRDEYLQKTLFKEWKQFINEWRGMDPYHIAQYLRYEDWVDDDRGPALTASLSRVLREEGFPLQYDDETDSGKNELECLWHAQIHEAMISEELKLKDWYTPEYSKEQLDFLAGELQTFIDEIKGAGNGKRPGDNQLVAILSGYRKEVVELIV